MKTKSSIAPPFEVGVDLSNGGDKTAVVVVDVLPEAERAELQARGTAMNALATMPAFWRARFEALVQKHGNTRLGRRATASMLRRYVSWRKRTDALRARQAAERTWKLAAAEEGT